jgi:hypothetical protein
MFKGDNFSFSSKRSPENLDIMRIFSFHMSLGMDLKCHILRIYYNLRGSLPVPQLSYFREKWLDIEFHKTRENI